MRDIRPDLRERLQAVDSAAKALQIEAETLRLLLVAEDKRWEGVSAQKELVLNGDSHDAAPATQPGTALASILRERLSDHKKHHLDELRDMAVQRGYPFGEKKPGRVVHFALLGMSTGSAGAVEQLGGGFWRLKES